MINSSRTRAAPFQAFVRLAVKKAIGGKGAPALGMLGLLLALTAAPVCAQSASTRSADVGTPIVIGHSQILRSKVLQDDRRLAVYLPPSYSSSKRSYPVIYLLDGGADEDFHHITGLARVSAAYETMEEVIVVGIEGVDRRHDLTERSKDPADLKSSPTSGGSAAYRRFLVDEVQPWVRNRYRTSGRTALLGESFAGLFVVETVLRQPAAFTDYIAVSPSLWWNRQALSREAEKSLRTNSFAGKRLWLSLADEGSYHVEMKSGVERLVATLRKVDAPGLKWSFTSLPTETHATTYLPAATIALRTLFAKPKATGKK